MYGVERSMLPGFSLYGNVSQALNHSLLSTNRHDLLFREPAMLLRGSLMNSHMAEIKMKYNLWKL